jgi:hypothetical protein
MTEHSGNGWPVLDRDQLHWFTAAGERFAAASDDVAYVAGYLITRFDAEVEPIAGKVLDDWSYAVRPVRGGTIPSNHASATAWDLNATKHPRGVHGTFTTSQVATVRRILADLSGVFRWGNDYVNSPIDSMHFEINTTPAQIAQARTKLEENDMEWTDKIKLTKVDAREWGTNPDTGKPYKEGDLVSVGQMLRYPTLARKIDAKLDAFIEAQEKRDAAILAAIQG